MSVKGTTAKPFVVVGVDGSPNSTKALRAALQEAAWRGADVHALIGWTYPVMYGMEGGGYVIDNETVEKSAFVALEEAIARACPDETERAGIQRFAVGGSPAESLIEASKTAELLVVGARGHGGFLGLLLGSVSSQVVKHAHCPVLVLPPDVHGPASDD